MMFIAHTLITLRDKLAASDKERGATAIEYALIVGLVSIALVVAMMAIGISDITTAIQTWLTSAKAKIPTSA